MEHTESSGNGDQWIKIDLNMVIAVSHQKEVGIQSDHNAVNAQHLDALEQCHGSSFQAEASRKLIKEFGIDTKDEQDRLNIGAA